jgi:hypothetical protein
MTYGAIAANSDGDPRRRPGAAGNAGPGTMRALYHHDSGPDGDPRDTGLQRNGQWRSGAENRWITVGGRPDPDRTLGPVFADIEAVTTEAGTDI